jgi:hypothetical protein
LFVVISLGPLKSERCINKLVLICYVRYVLTYNDTIKKPTGSESQSVPDKEMTLYMFNFNFQCAVLELRCAIVKFGLQLMQNHNSKFH